MICKIQVVTLGEDGREETFEIACLERTDLKPETLGLTLAEGKRILKDLQQIVVESQVASFLLPKRACPECSQPRCTKGYHTLSVRTIFGQLTVQSPRLHHCACRSHDAKTFSPLAEQGHWFLSSASRSCIGIPNTFGMESTPWHGQYSLILIALVNSAIGHSKINATEPAG
jgi:hypothetical protein